MFNSYKDWWENSLPERARSLIKYATLAAWAVVLGLSCFTMGHIKGSADAEVKIEQYKTELAKKEAEFAKKETEVSVKVVTEYKDRIQVVKEKEIVYVEKASNDVPTQYELSTGWVQLHDTAARGEDAKGTSYADGTPSSITDTAALSTVVNNYSICHGYYQQLISLQDWVRSLENAFPK